MILVRVFVSILNQMEFQLVQNRQDNCYCDHIPFNLKGNENLFLWAYCDTARTQRNIFRIWLNQTESRLYLPYFDWFGTKRTSFWFQINRKMVNTICFQFGLPTPGSSEERTRCDLVTMFWLQNLTLAVREARVSLHNRGRFKGHPYTNQLYSSVIVR